jgi:hypothetical protein
MPGIGELIDGAMQHAPQAGRQSMGADPIGPISLMHCAKRSAADNDNASYSHQVPRETLEPS